MASDEMKMGKNNGNNPSPADDDWERMIDNGSLDRAIEKLSMKNNSKGGGTDAEKDLDGAPKVQVQVRLEEPPTRTPFTPMVRILKRESANSPKIAQNNDLGTNNANGSSAQKNPPTTKTFAQRQDEYARARARIMGNQSSNVPAAPNGNFRASLLDSSNNRHQEGQPQPPQQQQQQQQQQFYKDRRTNGR